MSKKVASGRGKRAEVLRIVESMGWDDAREQPLFLSEKYYDDAIVGVSQPCQGNERKLQVVYDMEKVFRLGMKHNKWTYEESVEWHMFNTLDAWMGDGTPLFIRTIKNGD